MTIRSIEETQAMVLLGQDAVDGVPGLQRKRLHDKSAA